MSGFSAMKTESLLHTFLALFGGKLPDLDDINFHGVRILSFGRGGDRLVGLVGRLGVSLARSHWVWKEMAFSYQLSMVDGTVSMDMI